MTRDEFQVTSSFIEAFKKRDIWKVNSIFQKELYTRMDTFSRQLTQELIQKISQSSQTDQPEFNEILKDKSIDELERRKQMFEFFASTKKKR
jgi:hypothetical protein